MKKVDIEAEKAAAIKVMEKIVEAESRRDVDTAIKYYTEDAIFQAPDMPQIKGIKAVREVYTEFFKMPFKSFESGSTETVVAESGDMAYDIGWNILVFDGPDGDMEVRSKYLAILRKIDGEWKTAVLAFSNDQPAK